MTSFFEKVYRYLVKTTMLIAKLKLLAVLLSLQNADAKLLTFVVKCIENYCIYFCLLSVV